MWTNDKHMSRNSKRCQWNFGKQTESEQENTEAVRKIILNFYIFEFLRKMLSFGVLYWIKHDYKTPYRLNLNIMKIFLILCTCFGILTTNKKPKVKFNSHLIFRQRQGENGAWFLWFSASLCPPSDSPPTPCLLLYFSQWNIFSGSPNV